jgi:hypothetical protein
MESGVVERSDRKEVRLNVILPQTADRLRRRIVHWDGFPVYDFDGVYAHPEERSQWTLMIPGEPGRKHEELEALFRWEDDGGRTT